VSPNSKNSLESLFDKEGMDKEVQQNAAGVWGVPRSLLSSPKIEDPPQEEWGLGG
jgi:arginine/lysine/ornithine decarboxylase